MALLSTYQKFKEKNTQGGQSEPQKQQTQKGNSGSGLMSTYQQFMSKKQGGTQAVSPAQDYNQRVWDVLQRVDSANASRNGGWSADVTGGNSLEINALLREYDAYEGDKSGMTDYRNMLLGYNKQMQELNGYYSKFRDSDDYDRQRSGYGNFGVGYSAGSWWLSDSEARDIRKQQSQKDAQESQRALAEYTAAKEEFAGVDQEYRIHSKGDSDGGAFSDEYDQELTDRWNAAKAKVDSAENALRTARDRLNSYNATWGKIDQYAGDTAAAKGTDTAYRGVSYDELTGWENRRQEEQAAQDAQAMMPDHAPGALKYTADTEPQVDDALGLWRSMTQQQRQDAVSSSNGQLSKLANEGAASYWDLLTDDEVSTYYYIRNQRGQEAANQYLEDMYIELTRRNEAGMVQGIENASALEKTGMVAASVGANLLGAIPAAMGTTADLIAGRKNPYSSSGLFKRYASYVRGTVGQDIGDWTEDQLADKYGEAFAAKAGEFANQTFQAFMSGVDSVAGGKFFGQGLGIPVGPFDMHVGGYTTVMGLGAFADRAQEMQLKGATTAQIALGAIGSGVLEALFEDVSMEAFFTNILDNPATTLKEFTKKLAVQMGVEASEEVFTEIGNILWDGIVMGKNSDTETATREYMAQGMTEQEARQRATLDNIQDIVWAGYGGAISAGAMAAGGQAIGSVAENYAVGKELQKNGRAVDLQEQAESLTNEKKRAKLQKAAAEVANKASAGDKSFRNTYRTGKLATQIAQQAGREARGAETVEFRKAAEKYLEGQRGIQNKKHALNVLTRAYDGTAMLPGDKAYMRMIGGEKLTQEILNSVGGKETLQENAKPSVEASMRTIGNVQGSVLGIAPETKAEFDSDNSGQAFRKSDSEPINILASEPIARVENGILYLNTDDGQEIAASDVSYGNSGEAAVYAAISNMQTDTETARSLLSGIDDSGLSSAAYARAIRNAYYRGMNGVKFEDTPGYSDAAKLPETQRRAAWEAGKQRRAAKAQAQEALIDSGKAGTRESGVTMQESAKSIRSLNKQQQTGMAAAKALAAAGLHVEVYASTEAERKAGKPNGVYRKADGSIAIDLNAGDNGQGAVAYALAHETTHFIKDYSPAKYEAYAQLIIAAAENKGISYDSLLARQLARLSEMEEYKGRSETELQEIAYDETIAEMSETILTDTDAANRLSQQVYKQDRTLWQKIKDFFTGLVEKLRNAYKDSDPDSDIGRMLKRAVQDNAEIAQAWAEAVAEAGENYQLQDGQKKNAREGVRYSLRGTTDGKTVAVVDEDILSNIDLTQWNNQTKKKVQAAAKEALKKFSDGIVVDGITRNVNRVSRREFAASDYSEMLSKKAPQLFADKMRTASAIDDVVIATTDWARDGKLKHPRTDNFVDFDHGRVLIKAGENQYSAEVVVGITDKGTAVFYDVVDIQPAHFQMQKEESPTDVTTNKSPDVIHGNSSEDTLPQQGTEVKGNVRYSDRNSQSRQVERLEKKNAELKAEAEYLKQVVNVQKSGNKAHILDRSSVNAIGKGLMESVNAKGSEFGKLLNDFYRALGTEDMSYETMQDRAGELADWLLEHHQAERDGYAQDILDFLKKRRVSLSDGQIGDIEYSYGSLNDFKRAIKGSIILDQNAETSLDQLWQEAAAQFPDRFGADVTESNMPDGLAQIVSWANSTESSSEAEFQYYRAEQKADLTQKILMGYLEAKPMESVSDNMKKELETLKEQHKKEIKQLRKEWDAEAAAMEKSHAYDLEAEKKRGAAAIDAMKAAQAAIDKANAALWEVERNEIKLSYDRQMAKLRTTYSTDTAAYQNEFFEALKSEEYKDAKSPTLRRMLKELANEKSDGNKDAETSRKQVYENLRQQYELEKDIGKLEAKVKQQREAAAQKVESRKKTEERHKLQNTIDTLNKYLLQPTNTAHVPQGLQSSVAMALRAINGVIGDSKAAQNADRLAEYAYRLRELEKNPSANADKIADLNRKIQNLTGKDSSMKAALAELQEQYHKLETQGDSLYDSNIEALIQNTMEQIGDTEYRNLSLQQLKAVRDSYTALLTTIRNANKAFVAGKNARIDEMVKRATTELSLMKKKNPNQTAIGRNIEQFFWNNEKPVYAFERIGSAVMSELYDNLRKGEDTFYRDVSEARKFFLESAEKNGFSKWNLNELKEFTAANGQKFQLSLDELMSLYAYSLRPQAREHLTKGGIVLGENTKRFTKGPLGVTRETTYNDANAYTLTDETIDAIAGSLTKEQRQFAFEMQQYLAKIMGAKGDEVNMALYGIKKFGEETYWPLKSSDVFSERVRAQQDNPGNKLKNKGFTKALTPKANNAIELSTLTETWAEHVSDMSMYHSFTLPMEDFYRVYNWNQKGDGQVKSTMGVRQLIQKTAGKGAVNYIDQFLKDLNGGLRADPRETVSKAMLSGFKKAAVSASLSVAIQQPSAVGRALAYIEPKYFIGSKVEGTKFAETWEQLKKYAAVAGLKEMGRFDVDMGRSTLEYIIGRNGLSTWGKITDKVDKFSGWLPEMADQVTWCGIWEAAKRKTAAQNPGLRGEALLQKAGELFTDTITRTQVYDSVFSRSANMRSKSGLMSMATAFMAEPTTTANMVEEAVRKFARGDKRMAGKVLSSVAVATVLNAALAAVVYAARDDDDDKTYWEKYMASLAGETVDSLNPLTYIPVLSDINNLLLGYSIERTDMSLASDLITALKKITTLYGKYDDEWSDEKKDAWKKKVRTAWLDNAWMVGTVMGLPLKNVVRDVEAIINTARNPSNGAEMSADTVLKAMKDSARKNFPILSWKADESSSDQLYKAITQGKDVLARRLKAQFGDEKKYESALLKGLRENDPRIKTAAQYAIDGNTPKRVAIIREIVAEGHYTQDQVIKAINQKANSMKEKTQSGKESPPEKLYDYSEYVNAAANGLGYASDVQKELIRYQADRNQEADGKLTRQEAESDALKTFMSNVKSDAKDGYAAGDLTEAQVRKVLTAADIAEDEELDDLILQWDTEMELGDEISWSNARYLDYAETIHPAGISADTYDSYIRAVSRLSSIDEDGDGKTDITKQEQVIEYIDSMPISAEQKDALFQAEYPKARKSVLRKLPW